MRGGDRRSAAGLTTGTCRWSHSDFLSLQRAEVAFGARAPAVAPLRRAQSPHKWLDRVRPDVHIVAITGSEDRNTFPRLAKDYIAAAHGRGLQAEFVEVADAEHNLTRPLRDAAVEAFRGMSNRVR